MIDNKMLQGLLIASSVCMLLAIILSLGQYNQYRHVGVVQAAPAARPSQPAEPQPASAGDSQVIGAVYVDVQKIVSAPMLQSLAQQQGGVPQEAKEVGKAVGFMLPPAGAGQAPPFYAMVELTGSARQEAEQQIAAEGTAVTVEGLQAYREPDGKMVAAFAADGALLMASSEQLLAQAIKLQGAGQLTPTGQIGDLMKTYEAFALRGAFLITDQVKASSPQEAPSFLASMTATAFGLNLTTGLQIDSLMRFPSAADAQAAVDGVSAKIAEAKQQMTSDPQMGAMMAPVAALFDKVQVAAQGNDCRVSITLAEQDVQSLVPMATMMLMGAMMGGGAQGGGMPMAMPGGMQ